MTETILHKYCDVSYLPTPNRVEIVLSGVLCETALTKTAFMVPLFDNGDALLAVNQRRGVEIPGGHVEPGETLLDAAMRENKEETGSKVFDVIPLGFLRMTSQGVVPDDWSYPHPVGYQQFFAGRICAVEQYRENDECAEPIRIGDATDDRITRPSIRLFIEAAREALMPMPTPA